MVFNSLHRFFEPSQFVKNSYVWYCWRAMVKWNIKVENILEKRRIKIEKNEDEHFQLFIENRSSLQNLITKMSILADQENIIFWVFC